MLQKVANTVKGLSVDAVQKANSGHPGMPVGCAELGSFIFSEILSHYPNDPAWPDRDRFVLSAGHGSMLLYSLLFLSGYNISIEDLKKFRQLESSTPGHPEYRETEGVEATTGPLGQGLGNAVGMAIAERMMSERYNTERHSIVDHYTYVLASDGDFMEGISSEVGSLAGHLGLGKLIVFYDSNEISIEGSTDLTFTENVPARFESFGWHTVESVDGYDYGELNNAVKKAWAEDEKPTLIEVKTKIAKGAPTLEDDASSHGAPLGEDEIRGLKEHIDLPPDKKFYVPEEVKDFWHDKLAELRCNYNSWQEEFKDWKETNDELFQSWQNAQNLEIPKSFYQCLEDMDMNFAAATRKSAGKVLSKIMEEVNYLVGGSADLAPSNKTYQEEMGDIQAGNYSGRNFHFGVREHGMGGIINGISLHKGLRPFGATFLMFSDYMRPAIRLAAMMGLPNIYIFTHDSIFIGEDGPTHQPVEQLESLRLIPNLKVLRPADSEEVLLAWKQALKNQEGPTALILTRQDVPFLDKDKEPSVKRGGYVVKESLAPDAILMASGSEVSLALEISKRLKKDSVKTRVISVPDRYEFYELLKKDDKILKPDSSLKVVLEAGVSNGWHKFIGPDDFVISVEDFGYSAPGDEVGKYFGFDKVKISDKIISKLNNRNLV